MAAPSINLFSPEFDANPFPFYQEIRENHPLFYYAEADAYVLSRFNDVALAFKNPAFTVKNYEFQSEPLHGRTFIQMDGAEHSKYRNIVAPSIRGRDLMQKIKPIIEQTARELYQPFKEKNTADFAVEFAARFPILVIIGLLGLDKKDESSFLTWYRTFVDFIADLGRTPEITEAAFRTKEEITDYLLPIIAHKRDNPADDLLSTMCQSEIDGVRMSDQEIKAFISLLITAGGESTDKMLSLTLRNLLMHPEQLEAVRHDRSLIANAFAESLRFSPVTHRIMRITSEEVEVSGGTIPAEAKVIMLLGAAQHDKQQFDQPEQFNIFREDLDVEKAFSGSANHMAFGAGRHFCVGAMLAKVEMEVAFDQLLDLTTSIELAEPDNIREQGLFTRGIEHLKINYTLS